MQVPEQVFVRMQHAGALGGHGLLEIWWSLPQVAIDVGPAHCGYLDPAGSHLPVHCPLVHANSQVMPSFHWPSTVHVWTVVVVPLHWSEFGMQTPQMPVVLQTPPVPHLPPAATGVSTGVDPLQLGVLQPPLGSLGTSVVSTVRAAFPAPSHVSFWQSPDTCNATGRTVPAGATALPQAPWMHAATRHGLAGAGQSVASTHDMTAFAMSSPWLAIMASPSTADMAASSAGLMSSATLMSRAPASGPWLRLQHVWSLAHQ
jgi:hypothetical protein